MSLANIVAFQSSVKHLFIRGSVVRYVHLPAGAVDTALLEDATRRGKTHSQFASVWDLLTWISQKLRLEREQRRNKEE